MELLAEEVGIHIGDGSMNFYLNGRKKKGFFQLRGHIMDDMEYYHSHLKKLYYNLFGIKISIREMKSDGVLGFQIWSDELISFKRYLGLPLGKKDNINIPPIFLGNNKIRIGVLRGIFDTDGCIYLENKRGKLYPRIEIRTTSSTLTNQMVRILKDNNIRATSYTIKQRNKNWKEVMSTAIRGANEVKKFFCLVEPHNPKHISRLKRYLIGETDNQAVGSSNLPQPMRGLVA